MQKKTKTVNYNVGGHGMHRLSRLGRRRSRENGPACSSCTSGGGSTTSPRGRANELAKLGYVAFACDMFGGGKAAKSPDEAAAADQDNSPTTFPEWQERASACPRCPQAATHVRCRAGWRPSAIASAVRRPSLLACSGADLGGVVTFHAGLAAPSAPEQAQTIRPSLVICRGRSTRSRRRKRWAKFRKALEDAHVDYESRLTTPVPSTASPSPKPTNGACPASATTRKPTNAPGNG